MRIISIDVGIKNLAICVIDTDASSSIISNWQIINLCTNQPSCNFTTRNGCCGKIAKYSKQDKFFCKLHASKSNFILPENMPSYSKLIKNDKEYLINLINMNSDYKNQCDHNTSKKDMANIIHNGMVEKILNKVPQYNANTIELPELGYILYQSLDKSLELTNIDEIIIENQIAPIANRMKCLQCMLTQYFLMRGFNPKCIKFVSAKNKLRYLSSSKDTYNERKKLGILETKHYLDYTASPYSNMFNTHSKKDDLADCLLQGLSYLIEKGKIDNIFLNADYLK